MNFFLVCKITKYFLLFCLEALYSHFDFLVWNVMSYYFSANLNSTGFHKIFTTFLGIQFLHFLSVYDIYHMSYRK